MKRHWSGLLTTCAIALGLGSFTLAPQSVTHGLAGTGAQAGRTWTVCAQGCDFASIQQAIDAAGAGDRIWIKPGTYAEHLVIRKSLTLEGSGAKETVIKGAQPDKPILFIPDGASIEVRLADLALIGSLSKAILSSPCDPVLSVGQCPAGIEVGGAAQLSLYRVRLEDHWSGGIWIYGPARVQLFDSQIGSTNIGGVQLYHRAAELWVVGSQFSVGYNRETFGQDRRGIWASHSRQITVVNSTFSRSDTAIHVEGQAQIVVINARFLGAGVLFGGGFRGDKVKAVVVGSEFLDGASLSASDESQITVVNSRFKHGGIVLSEKARAVIQGTEIAENAGNGVLLHGSGQVYLEGNRIVGNGGWGVALGIPQCDYDFGLAAPQVSGRDNEIPDKDQPNGNKKGALCPAGYPWPPGFRK